MSSRAFAMAVAGAVLAAVVLGIATIGGPGEARRQKYDDLRYQDLAFLSNALLCRNMRVGSPVLPEELTVESLRAYCGGIQVLGPDLTDKETERPYSYRRTGDGGFEVCAEFHDAEETARRWQYQGSPDRSSFDSSRGCVTGSVQ